ncbi:hypothetical protein Q4I32_002149 [Leishmania shawi]|uniref:Uncharacterized protein n=1 Tax=Leishmania shawi TaxID=5680 RepID=A0AAW3C1B4_9TRYP
MRSAGSAASTGASLTVDELQEKLTALHDYLSTPYRARAEAILQQRRQREARASLNRSDHVLPGPEKANQGRFALKYASATCDSPAPSPNPSPDGKNVNSTGKKHDERCVPVSAAASTIPTELTNRCGSEHEVAEGDGDCGLSELSPTARPPAESLPMDPHTRRYVQQLEWQVKMLADALQQERKRLEEVDACVVQPLLRLGEAALQREVQLECALELCRARECDKKDPWRDEAGGKRNAKLLGNSLVDMLTEARTDAARS